MPKVPQRKVVFKWHYDEALAVAHKLGTACRLGLMACLQLLALGRALQHLAQAHMCRQVTTLLQR